MLFGKSARVVILSGVVVRKADDYAVEEPAPSQAEGTSRSSNPAEAIQGILLSPLAHSERGANVSMRPSDCSQIGILRLHNCCVFAKQSFCSG